MEIQLRGWVEKELDKMLRTDYISRILLDVCRKLPTGSVEDFCFGFIVGHINAGSQGQAIFYHKREMTREEWDEVMNIIERRTMEIKGRLKYVLGRYEP